MPFFVYLLECRDGSYYCGYAKDLSARIAAHNKGTASKYTRVRRPVRVIYSETTGTAQDAMRREREIKSLTKREKIALVEAGRCQPARMRAPF